MNPTPYGFRIVGACTEARRLIDHAAAFLAYATLDERAAVHREGYLSAFQFDEDFKQLLEGTGSPKGFNGSCWSAWQWWDIDRRDDLQRALDDARRLAAGLVERYRLDDDALLLFFSGSKGFHVGLPTSLWNPAPFGLFNATARRFAEGHAARLGVAIDSSIFDRVRALRAPNSKHPKTGLHKRRLSLDELLGLSLDGILSLAKEPAAFELPTPPAPCDQAIRDWQETVALVGKEAEAKAQRRGAAMNGTPTLNRATLAFIREGAGEGDRHRLLFSAAANLAEYGCPPALAHGLLSEAALDSGLSPSEVRRQIDCGLAFQGGEPAAPQALAVPAPLPSASPDLAKELAVLWSNSPTPAPADQGDDLDAAGERAAPSIGPTPPPDAKLFCQDEHARPCSPESAYLWTWEGGPQWFYAARNPIPGFPARKKGGAA